MPSREGKPWVACWPESEAPQIGKKVDVAVGNSLKKPKNLFPKFIFHCHCIQEGMRNFSFYFFHLS